jgi:hypothetical protein
MRMVVCAVFAALALAQLVARQAHVKAFAVLLPALSLSAMAPFLYSTVQWVEVGLPKSVLGNLSRLGYQFLVLAVV